MQMKKAIAVRAEWGDKPCDHPRLSKAYDLGKQTGGYLCDQCGRSITRREREEIKTRRPA